MLLDFMETILDLVVRFILDEIVVSFVSSFFTVVGGAAPIAILIYLFSKEERKRLLAHAVEIEKTLPLQEQLLKKMSEVIEKSISPQSLAKNIVLERKDSVMVIPEGLLKFENDSSFVEILIGEEQQFEKRFVKTGLSDGINIEITDGLKKEDKVKGEKVDPKKIKENKS